MTNGIHLLIETSGRRGFVGLVHGGVVAQASVLDETRRHARDLAENVRQLFDNEKIKPATIVSVIVSLGPGSYTGLRVGLASAKALAYAVDVRLVGVPTFHAIANRTPPGVDRVTVITDALQGLIYVQNFRRNVDWEPIGGLRIENAKQWAARLTSADIVTGPGVAMHNEIIPQSVVRLPEELRTATIESLWLASMKLQPLSREELFRLEPLYLRGSSAEEKRKAQSVNAAIASARVS